MIYIFNIVIALFCIIIIIILNSQKTHIKNHFKKHIFIFLIKLLFISMFIYFFIFNFSISNYRIFIISGYVNFTIFHVIEGFVNQKKFV